MNPRDRAVGIVDDTLPMRELMTRIVNGIPGTQVAWAAEDGHEALALATEDPPDLLIVDLFLPGVRGEDLIEAVRTVLPSERTRILVLTGTLDTHRREQAIAAGADACLQKGGDLAALRSVIRELTAE